MPESPLRFSLELALSGSGAPSKSAYEKALSDAGGVLAWLREQHRSGSLELLGIPAATVDLKAAAKLVPGIVRGMKSVAVLGIGGSSLGGQALTALMKPDAMPRVEFHDNPDPFSWAATLARLDLKKSHFIAISKSGGTAETLMQVLTAAEALKKAGAKSLKKHFTVITEPHQSPLADFADSIGAARLDHPTGVGGRYSVLTVVGMLAALIMGLDAKKLRGGAAAVLAQTLNAKSPADAPPATGAALAQALAAAGKLNTAILWWPYADKLAVFGG